MPGMSVKGELRTCSGQPAAGIPLSVARAKFYGTKALSAALTERALREDEVSYEYRRVVSSIDGRFIVHFNEESRNIGYMVPFAPHESTMRTLVVGVSVLKWPPLILTITESKTNVATSIEYQAGRDSSLMSSDLSVQASASRSNQIDEINITLACIDGDA